MEKLKSQIKECISLRQNNQLYEAKVLLNNILQADNSSAEAWHQLALIAVQEDDYPSAKNYLEKALAHNSQNAEVCHHLGNIYKAMGDLHQAETFYRQAIQLKPDFPECFNNLGNLYFKQGNFEKAIEAYNQALTLHPSFYDAHINVAIAYFRLGKMELAQIHFEQILAFLPEDIQTHYYLAYIFSTKNQWKKAILHYKKILEKIPTHLETFHNIAHAYLALRELNSAQLFFEKLIELKPDSPDAHYHLALIASSRNFAELAKHHYQKAIEYSPNFFAAFYNLAICHLHLNQREEALKQFEDALQIWPNNPSIQYLIHAIKGVQTATEAPAAYIQSLFDSYANSYEVHLSEGLEYSVPEKFFNYLQKFQFFKENRRILDLGCGTGLMGKYVYRYASTLVGVDISGNMLTQANHKKIYNALFQEDNLKFLIHHEQSYDLIIAADVFIYAGDLEKLFFACAKRLNRQGIFAFSLEKNESTENFTLSPSGRFQHSPHYVKTLAEKAGFTILLCEDTVTRKQFNENVDGVLFILQYSELN